jgi:hypothetical protein
MDFEDFLTLVGIVIVASLVGIAGWVLIETGVYLHNLNGW